MSYKLYFDNAAGIKLGAPVMLAGRKIGQVQKSALAGFTGGRAARGRSGRRICVRRSQTQPLVAGDREPKYEVRIDVRWTKMRAVYRDAHVRLMQLGLLGEMAIDITQGTENSPAAPGMAKFRGRTHARFQRSGRSNAGGDQAGRSRSHLHHERTGGYRAKS